MVLGVPEVRRQFYSLSMNSGKIGAGQDGWKSRVLPEVLADLKIFLFDRKYAGSYTTNAERAKYFNEDFPL